MFVADHFLVDVFLRGDPSNIALIKLSPVNVKSSWVRFWRGPRRSFREQGPHLLETLLDRDDYVEFICYIIRLLCHSR